MGKKPEKPVEVMVRVAKPVNQAATRRPVGFPKAMWKRLGGYVARLDKAWPKEEWKKDNAKDRSSIH